MQTQSLMLRVIGDIVVNGLLVDSTLYDKQINIDLTK